MMTIDSVCLARAQPLSASEHVPQPIKGRRLTGPAFVSPSHGLRCASLEVWLHSGTNEVHRRPAFAMLRPRWPSARAENPPTRAHLAGGRASPAPTLLAFPHSA